MVEAASCKYWSKKGYCSTYSLERPSVLHVCPICKGRGAVPAGFYDGDTWRATTVPERCRSCRGRGYILA